MKILSCAAALCLVAAPALAAAHLVKVQPPNGARIKSPRHIVLTFSEALEPAFSGAILLDQQGRNRTGEPVRIDGRIMRFSPHRLAPGRYTISWNAVGYDGHARSGRIHFIVRP